MKAILRLSAAMLIGYASLAYGAGADQAAMSPIMIAFLSFIALFLVGQLLPGARLFWTLLKGLFAPGYVKRPVVADGKPQRLP